MSPIKYKFLIFLFLTLTFVCSFKTQSQHEVRYTSSSHYNNHIQKISNHQKRYLQTVSLDSNSFNQQQNYKFDGLILTHQIPTTFTNSQIFQIRGSVTSPAISSEGIFVNFILINKLTTQRFNFYTWLAQGVTGFVFNVDFRTVLQGDYDLALFPGKNGPIQQTIYKVISYAPNNQVTNPTPFTPSLLTVKLEQNKLFLTWQSSLIGNIVEKVVFRQGFTFKQYYLSNFNGRYEVQFKDFASWNQYQTVSVSVSSALSSSVSHGGRISQFTADQQSQTSFSPIKHHFSQIKKDQIVFYEQLPWQIQPYQRIVIRGRALVDLSNKIVVEKPSKTFGQYYFNQQNKEETIRAGTDFYKQIIFTQSGPHIFEINNVNGGAALNRPFYVSSGFPLLPDFVDLTVLYTDNSFIINSQPSNIFDQRNLLLNLVNSKRVQFGVSQIVSDSSLDQLAQGHSDDMTARRFFGHYNPDGQGPQERARRQGITAAIGENVAYNINLTQGHLRLCRSPVHLQNIVNSQWTRVGFGVSRDSIQFFNIVQQFGGRDYSTTPLTSSQTASIKDNLVSYIIQNYQWIKSQNTGFSSVLSQWQNLSSEAQNSQSIVEFIRQRGFRGFSIDNIVIYYTPQSLQSYKKSDYFKPSKVDASQMGLSAKLNGGQLQVFIGYL